MGCQASRTVSSVSKAVPALCDPAMMQALSDAAEAIAPGAWQTMPSGAGHDAMAIAAIADVAMLFVRCGNGGISHHPTETMTAEDAEIAARVFADFVEHFQRTQ